MKTATILLLLALAGQSHAACDWPAVRQTFGGEALARVAEFRYQLQIGASRSAYVLHTASGAVQMVRDGTTRWWDGQQGWASADGQWSMLGEAAGHGLRDAGAYNFLRLFADPGTGVRAAGPNRLQVTPSQADAFEIELDPASCRIVANHFGPALLARELDYRAVGAIQWPMRFRVEAEGKVLREGVFSDLALSETAPPFSPAVPAAVSIVLPAPGADAIGAALVAPGTISTEKNEYNLSLNAREDLLVFARSEADFRGARILFARRSGAVWGTPAPVPFADARYRDSDPWLTPDGQWLYFISDRPSDGGTAPKKDFDLWRVRVSPSWGQPQALAGVNSAGQELGPELHDGWLYFNSTRPGGPARLAIYRARQLPDGRFDAPEALAAPFNDGLLQGDFTLAPDGKTALFWRQQDAKGDADLYAVRRIGEGWGKALRLPAPFSGAGFDFTPAFSADGKTVYFASERKFGAGQGILQGLANLYAAPRAWVEAALDGQ